jgi:hypothetical protein
MASCVLTNPFFSNRQDIEVKRKAPKAEHLIIKNVKNRVYCQNDVCKKVETITLVDDFSCYDEDLHITFVLQDANTLVNHTLKGYLPQGSGGEIKNTTTQLTFCEKVKRFTINERLSLLMLEDIIRLVENSKIDQVIAENLWANFKLIQYISFFLGIYNEKDESIEYLKASLVSFKNIIIFI